MITLIGISNSAATRKATACLQEMAIDYKAIDGKSDEFTLSLFTQILVGVDDEQGLDQVLAPRSKVYSELVANGVDFDTLRLSEIFALIKENPKLGAFPFLYDDHRQVLLTGFNNDEYASTLPSKAQRRAARASLLLSAGIGEEPYTPIETDKDAYTEQYNEFEEQDYLADLMGESDGSFDYNNRNLLQPLDSSKDLYLDQVL